jgi:hypothetical protein
MQKMRGCHVDEQTFKSLSRRAKLLTSDYGSGYLTGLRRHYHGESFGDPAELAAIEARNDERARGYRDGVAGKEPAPLRHRPPLPEDAERSDKQPRTIRLGATHWAKLRQLGMGWLESAIDNAPDPST